MRSTLNITRTSHEGRLPSSGVVCVAYGLDPAAVAKPELFQGRAPFE